MIVKAPHEADFGSSLTDHNLLRQECFGAGANLPLDLKLFESTHRRRNDLHHPAFVMHNVQLFDSKLS
ncbi:hypothetical protein D3C85_1821560 [compost metagenome]